MFNSDWIDVGAARRAGAIARICVLTLVGVFPAQLSATSSVGLAWDPSPATGPGGYVVRYATASGVYTSATNVGLVTAATISGLQEGATYYFAVTALSTDNVESDPSNEVSYSVPGAVAPDMSFIAAQSVSEDASTTVAFTVSSASVPADNLTIAAYSSDSTLVPPAAIQFGGSGVNRTAFITPTAQRSGSATLTFVISDGSLSSSRSFVLTVIGANDPPTLNTIASLTITEDSGVQSISIWGITCGDVDEIQAPTVTASSSNEGVIPNPAVSYMSPSTAGTLAFAPLANATGTATITVTVNDGQTLNNILVRTFVVTVNPVNDLPAISAIADQNVSAGASTPALAFSVSDVETAAGSLTLAAASSNPALVPLSGIVLGGSGSTRNVTVTPASGQSGTSTITVTVADGSGASAIEVFLVTVTPVNSAPTVSTISSQSIEMNATLGPISFTVGDAETPAGSLTLAAVSSNPMLLPSGNVTFGGSASNRTLSLTPAPNQTGSAMIGIRVSDGVATASTTFTVIIRPTTYVTRSFTNGLPITIPVQGKASLYPAPISVSSMDGAISNLTVTLHGLSHGSPDDLDVLLLGPGGQTVMLMSDVGGSYDIANTTFTFSDAASSMLADRAQLVSGVFKPRNVGTSDSLPAPAPMAPYSAQLSAFNGSQPNGTWSLYVFDDRKGYSGTLSGWSLSLATTGSVATSTFSLAAASAPGSGEATDSGAGNEAVDFKTANLGALILESGSFKRGSGTYHGLFHASDEVRLESAGQFTLTVKESGVFTGSLRFSAGAKSFGGQFDASGRGTSRVVALDGAPINISMTLDDADGEVTGELIGGGWRAALAGDLALADAAGGPSASTGVYLLRLPVSDNAAAMSEGVARLAISLDGTATVVGELPDGSPILHRTTASARGEVALFIPLGGGTGFLMGWLRVVGGEVTGLLNWSRRPADGLEGNSVAIEFNVTGEGNDSRVQTP